MTCSYKNELFIEKYQYVNNEGIKEQLSLNLRTYIQIVSLKIIY